MNEIIEKYTKSYEVLRVKQERFGDAVRHGEIEPWDVNTFVYKDLKYCEAAFTRAFAAMFKLSQQEA